MLDWGILILRVGIGIMFVAHGLQMAFGIFGGPGVKGFAQMLTSLGFAPAILWSYVAAYTVLIGGSFVIVGILTRPSALLLLIFILTAGVKVHLSKGFFLSNGGIEYTFVIAAACLSLVLLGGGKYSIFN